MKKVIEKQYPEFVVPEEIKDSVGKYTENLIDRNFVCKVPSKSVKDILRKIKDYIKIIIKYNNSVANIKCKKKSDRSKKDKQILSEYNNAKSQIRCCIANCGNWFRYEDYSSDDFDLKSFLNGNREVPSSDLTIIKIKECDDIKMISKKIKNIGKSVDNFMNSYNDFKNRGIESLTDKQLYKLKIYERDISILNAYKERYNELVSENKC